MCEISSLSTLYMSHCRAGVQGESCNSAPRWPNAAGELCQAQSPWSTDIHKSRVANRVKHFIVSTIQLNKLQFLMEHIF